MPAVPRDQHLCVSRSTEANGYAIRLSCFCVEGGGGTAESIMLLEDRR